MLIAFPNGWVTFTPAREVLLGNRMVFPDGKCLVLTGITRGDHSIAFQAGGTRRSRQGSYRAQVTVDLSEAVPILVTSFLEKT